MKVDQLLKTYNEAFSGAFQTLLKSQSLETLTDTRHLQPKLKSIAQRTAQTIIDNYRPDLRVGEKTEIIAQVDSMKARSRFYELEVERIKGVQKNISQLNTYFENKAPAQDSNKPLGPKDILEEFLTILQPISTYFTDKINRLNIVYLKENLTLIQQLMSVLIIQIRNSLVEDNIKSPYILRSPGDNKYPDKFEDKTLHFALQSINHVMQKNLSSFLKQELDKNLPEKVRFQLMHYYLKQSLTELQSKRLRLKKEPQEVSNWKNLLFIPNAQRLNVFREAKSNTIQYLSEPIKREERFAQANFSEAAVFSGTTYVGIEKPPELISGSSADAIAVSGDCFAVTDGYGYSADPTVSDRTKRVAGTIAKNLVRLASVYLTPETYKAHLPQIFFYQRQTALGKMEDEMYMQYATGCLVKTFTQADGSVRAIVGSMGDGIVLAVDPTSREFRILAEARQYENQPRPINVDEQDFDIFEGYLQITDTILPEGSIVLAFTHGVMSLFETKVKVSRDRGVFYNSIIPTEESIQQLFKELFKKDPYPSDEFVRTFVLKKLAEKAELTRQSLSPENVQEIREAIIKFASREGGGKDLDVRILKKDEKLLKRFIRTTSISSFLRTLDKKQKKLVKSFLKSAKFAPKKYDSRDSLLALYDSTSTACAGDDASLLVKILGEYPFLKKCREIEQFFEQNKNKEISIKDNMFGLKLEEFKNHVRYIFKHIHSPNRGYITLINNFVEQAYGKSILEWLEDEINDYCQNKFFHLITRLIEIRKYSMGSLALTSLQAQKLLNFYFEIKKEPSFKDSSHDIGLNFETNLYGLIMGHRQANLFLNRLADNGLEFLRTAPLTIGENVEELQPFWAALCPRFTGEGTDEKFDTASKQMTSYFITLEIVKIIGRFKKRLPQDFNNEFYELLSTKREKFLSELKNLAKKNLEAIQQKAGEKQADPGQSSSQAGQHGSWFADPGQSSSPAEQKQALLSSDELEFFYTLLMRLDIEQEASVQMVFIQFNEWTKVPEQEAEMSLRR